MHAELWSTRTGFPPRERYYVEGWYYSTRRGTWDRAIEAYRQSSESGPQ